MTVLNASRHNSKIILHGVIQRYYQQNGSISLVDIFGMLLGGTLLSRKLTVTPAPPGDNNDSNQHWYYSEDIEEQSSHANDDTRTIHEDDGAEVKPRLLKKDEIKLSKQKVYFEDGSLPMPIYCAVRHEIESAGVTKADTISSKKDELGEEKEMDNTNEDVGNNNQEQDNTEEEQVAKSNDLYQWFEFTPYDMGSEEINGM